LHGEERFEESNITIDPSPGSLRSPPSPQGRGLASVIDMEPCFGEGCERLGRIPNSAYGAWTGYSGYGYTHSDLTQPLQKGTTICNPV